MSKMNVPVKKIALAAAFAVGISLLPPMSLAHGVVLDPFGAIYNSTVPVLNDVMPINTITNERIAYNLSEVAISLPWNTGESILVNSDEAQLSVKLPETTRSNKGELSRGMEHEFLSYDNGDGSASVPIVHSDSLQINTVISRTNAPVRYSYDFAGDVGDLLLLDDGSVSLVSLKGDFLGMIEKPWEVDATGKQVPTYYEVSGTILTQVVNHLGDRVAYPVVADPKVLWMFTGGGLGMHLVLNQTEVRAFSMAIVAAGGASAVVACLGVAKVPSAVSSVFKVLCAFGLGSVTISSINSAILSVGRLPLTSWCYAFPLFTVAGSKKAQAVNNSYCA